MKNLNNKKKDFGFTLIEILIALVIIAISLTAALQATSVNIKSQQRLAKNIKANIIAKSAIAESALSFQKQGQLQKSYQTEGFGMTWYWQVKDQPASCQDSYKLSVSILNKQFNASSIYTLSTYRIKP